MLLLGSSVLLHAQGAGVFGFWKSPGGSVLHVEKCGDEVCAVLAQISPSAPGRIDAHNPDKALRDRSLCGMTIAHGFRSASGDAAEGGLIYDPENGKTYHGRMAAVGNELRLRGYVGIPAFGRTETWTRAAATPVCVR